MSVPTAAQPVKLIVSLVTGDEAVFVPVAAKLSKVYGRLDYLSRRIPFDKTDYYEREMGKNLVRRLITFEKLMEPDALPGVKRTTDRIESEYRDREENRRINLDPGYLTLSHLILATHKQFSHRPYLRDGVYADLTLIYKGKSFQPLQWTFPDYAADEIIEIMNRLRKRYKMQMKGV